MIIDRGKKMMNSVIVESAVEQVRPKSSALIRGDLGTCIDLVLTKISDLLIAFGPLVSSSMSQKCKFREK